ncbi:MAG: amino acid ABC transporter permease [Chloroflexota bacterium]
MSIGSSTVDQGGADLGALIRESERRRTIRWRTWFVITWMTILTAMTLFIVFIVGVDETLITKYFWYIVGGGIGLTIFVSITSIALAILFATLGALGRLSRNPIFNGLASFYVSLVRGTPLLLQILFIYLALPQLGIVLPELLCGILALGFNYGAYMTEVFRAGIQAVPPGQTEAAQSLGMTGRTTFTKIVLPQAFRIVLPAIGNDFISMLKDSSLVSTIGVQELLWRARLVGTKEFAAIQTLLIAAAVYWVMTIGFSYVQARLEKRMAQGDRAVSR